jgi:hypothetical protein
MFVQLFLAQNTCKKFQSAAFESLECCTLELGWSYCAGSRHLGQALPGSRGIWSCKETDHFRRGLLVDALLK